MKKITESYKKEFRKFAENHTSEEIANKYNISKTLVRNRCYQWNIKYLNDYSKIDNTEIQDIRKYARNHTLKEIAKKFNLTYITAFQRCERFKIKYVKEKDQKKKQFKDTYEKCNYKCSQLGLTIPQYIDKHGINQYKSQILNS